MRKEVVEMQAILVNEFSEDAKQMLVEVPDPEPGEGEVLVDVKAIGVNYADILMRRGKYGERLSPPYTPGFEASGVVLKIGKGVTDWKPGQRVMGTVPRQQCGCYAEKAVMPAWLLIQVPDRFRYEDGAAFSEVFITAQMALVMTGRLSAGETVLIHAAAGGVGTAAVQTARALGARVIATASTEEKLRRVALLGADVLINYTTHDFEEEVQKHTGGKGVDLVLESVGGEVFKKSLQCLQPLGRLVVFGNSSGIPAIMKSTEIPKRMITISGFSLGTLTNIRPDIIRRAMDSVKQMLREDRIRSVVGKTFPLVKAQIAQDYITSRANIGKVLLIP
jgi:NADPH2:quinone reductase